MQYEAIIHNKKGKNIYSFEFTLATTNKSQLNIFVTEQLKNLWWMPKDFVIHSITRLDD